MKNISLLLVCVFGINFSFAQTRAITEKGEEVILYDDGTWKYENNDDINRTNIPTNPNLFKKDNSSTFLLKSNKVEIGFWINPKEWSFKKSKNGSVLEYNLELKKEGNLLGLIITERVEMPLQSLRTMALINAKNASPDVEIVEEEYRNVNGLDVLFLRMNGTVQGMKFAYFGYYYSSSVGTVQFITYTFQNLIDKYLIDCEKLLNGLVEVK
jgi:hypothetical protein